MFEKASRLGLRFNSSKGDLTVEDLWKLPLTSTTGKVNLDDIAKDLYSKVKSDAVVSFVDVPPQANDEDKLAFDIVLHIIKVRKAENEAAQLAAANKEKKQRLLSVLASKEDQALSAMSIEDIRAQINAL